MGFDGIKVNHAALDEAANDMQAAVTAIRDRLERLDSDLSIFKRDGAWEGQARNAYNEAKGKWDQAITEMNTLLQDAHRAVSDSNHDYKETDRKAAAGFGQ